MSDDANDVLPGGLTREQFIELRTTNPPLAARYADANDINEVSPQNMDDGRARYAAMRGIAPPPPAPPPDPNEVLPGGLTRAQYTQLRSTNPFAAARYAIGNRIHDDDT